MTDLTRDEVAGVIHVAIDADLPTDPTRAELQAACDRAADALLPLLAEKIEAARVEGAETLRVRQEGLLGRGWVSPETHAEIVAEARGEALREAGQDYLAQHAGSGHRRPVDVRRWLFDRAAALGESNE